MNKNAILQILVVTLCFMFQLIGCTTMQGFKRTFNPDSDPLLKKRALLAPIVIQMDMDEKSVQQLNSAFHSLIQKDDHLIVQKTDESILSNDEMKTIQFGVPLGPVLVEKLAASNIDVLVTAVLGPIDIVTEKKGFLFFKNEKSEAIILMMMSVSDTTTRTVLANHLETEEIRLPMVVPEDQETRIKIEDTVFNKALSSILDDLVQKTSETLKHRPWMGRLSMTGDQILQINGGQDIGVFKGSVFEVFRQGEPIENITGREQITLGTKVGEIKAVKVMTDYSIAEPISGEGFMDGQIIRIKRY
ncbi:MAG: hypothetical protein JW932_10685 [Deltaproteobacteria bacterium]|nr:hypothetical protein [Deltaproteobacteria bacterium]